MSSNAAASSGSVSSARHQQLLSELRVRVATVDPLPGENYHQDDETLLRFLKAREWNIDAAEKQLRDAIAWRRSYQPLSIDCRWCHEHPGYHSMRQVGFDEAGRPVIYSSFSQGDSIRYNVEDSVAHCTYLMENAKRTMSPGVNSWVFVIDCTGLSLPQCNPGLANGVVGVFSNFYPEQMERIVCVNHSSLFHGIWNAIKVFVDPKTVKKMKFVRGKDKMQRKFRELFGDRLTAWLLEEIRLNKLDPLPETQERFWEAPLRPGQHDPRGCSDYVETYVDPFFINLAQQGEAVVARPHPNIADQQTGRIAAYVPKAARKKAGKKQQQQLQSQTPVSVGASAADPSQSDVASATEHELLAAYGVTPASVDELEDGDSSDEDGRADSKSNGLGK